jgi:polysaccharide export outer membrane protein
VSPAAPEGATYDASILRDGTCTLPKVGIVRLQGLTVEEATSLLTRLYGARQAHVHAQLLVTQSQGRTRSFLDAMQGSQGKTRRCEVTQEGDVLLPLLEPIPAMGRSLDEVRRSIAAAYREQLPDLAVNTTLASRDRRTIAVLGEVARSGVYPAPYPMSPLEALSLAGGLTDRALRSQVILVRPEPDGSVSIHELDLDAALDRDDYSSLATAIRSRDLLYVPKSEIANINMFVQQYLRNMMPVPITVGVGWDLNQ